MAAVVVIEKGIPVPQLHQSAKFPFGVMEVGDSFFVVGVTAMTLHQSMRRHRPRRFTSRRLTEGGVRGIRIWRVE
jgi:hypothetical protein